MATVTLLTKQEEIDTYRHFVESLPPDSYLAEYLDGSVEQVESAIRADLPCTPINAARETQHALRSDLDSIRQEIRDALSERDELKRANDRAEHILLQTYREVANVGRTAGAFTEAVRTLSDCRQSAEKHLVDLGMDQKRIRKALY